MPLLGAPGVSAMVRVSIWRELYLSFIHSLNRVAIGLPCSGYSVSVRIPKCPKGGIPLHLLLLQPRVRSFSRVATPTLSRKCGGVSASRCFLPRGPCRPLVSPGVRSDRREKAQALRAEPLNWQAGESVADIGCNPALNAWAFSHVLPKYAPAKMRPESIGHTKSRLIREGVSIGGVARLDTCMVISRRLNEFAGCHPVVSRHPRPVSRGRRAGPLRLVPEMPSLADRAMIWLQSFRILVPGTERVDHAHGRGFAGEGLTAHAG